MTAADRRRRIFLVDDHPLVREWLSNLIERQPDLHVCGQAATSVAAYSAIVSLQPDVVIVDLSLESGSGLELIKHVKLLPGFRFTPILTLTTESQPEKRDEGKRLGATGWLVKPVSGTDLVKVIKQVLPGS